MRVIVLVLAFGILGPATVCGGQSPRKLVHSVLAWTDSARAEPWTADPADHRVIVARLSYRADAQTPRPLVLLSTGRNVSPSTYGDLADALADAGFVVAIVDHVGERSGTTLPDGTAVPNRLDAIAPKHESPTFRLDDSVFSRRWVELRAEDLTSARTHLQALAATSGAELSGRLNDRVAAIGHSLGGLTAAKSCERDPAVSACVNLDGLS